MCGVSCEEAGRKGGCSKRRKKHVQMLRGDRGLEGSRSAQSKRNITRAPHMSHDIIKNFLVARLKKKTPLKLILIIYFI